MKPLLIVKRDSPIIHYELHFNDHVKFVTLDGVVIGVSKVEPYET